MYYRNDENPSHLVTRQFTPHNFDVVLQVYNNLHCLQHLTKNLNVLLQLSNSQYRLEELEKYLGEVLNVSDNLRNIVELNNNIPLLQDIAPRINTFANTLVDVQGKLNHFDDKFDKAIGVVNSSIKALEDLYVQYEKGLQCIIAEYKEILCEDYTKYREDLLNIAEFTKKLFTEFDSLMPLVRKAAQTQADNHLLLMHLKTSDMVTTALFTGLESDAKLALKQIKLSEKDGNDESLNRARLNYKLPKNNVMNVIKVNNERLTKGGEECPLSEC